MDLRTVQFYGAHAREIAQRYAKAESVAARYFPVAFTPGSRALDVRCGAGRDLQALIDPGYAAGGVDASEEMLDEARQLNPGLMGRVTADTLPDLSTVADGSFDGVLCWAVLMHVPEELLFDTVFNLRRVLKPAGRLLISTPLGGPAVDPGTRRGIDGRLFSQVTLENLHFQLEKVGFRCLNRWDEADSLGGADFVTRRSGPRK